MLTRQKWIAPNLRFSEDLVKFKYINGVGGNIK